MGVPRRIPWEWELDRQRNAYRLALLVANRHRRALSKALEKAQADALEAYRDAGFGEHEPPCDSPWQTIRGLMSRTNAALAQAKGGDSSR